MVDSYLTCPVDSTSFIQIIKQKQRKTNQVNLKAQFGAQEAEAKSYQPLWIFLWLLKTD